MTNSLNKTDIDFNDIKAQAIADLKAGKSLIGQGGALTPLIKDIIEASLEGELEAHLDESSGNRRNGKSKKIVKSVTLVNLSLKHRVIEVVALSHSL